MKKLFFLICANYVFTLHAQTEYVQPQSDNHKGFSLGVNAGPNYTFIYGTQYIKNTSSPINFITAGISAQYEFKKVISVVSGLYYDKKGYGIDQFAGYSGPNQPILLRIRGIYNYISLPLMIRASFGKRVSFFVNAGGFISVLANAKEKAKFNYNYYGPNTVQVINETKGYRLLDAGAAAGIGGVFPLTGSMKFTLEIRNTTGLSDIGKNTTTHPLMTNATSVLFGLMYKF